MNHKPSTKRINLLSWLDRRRQAGIVSRHSVRPTEKLALAAATLASIIFMASPAHSALMAYEGFNYPAGSGNLTGLSGGFGWSGGWQGVNNGSSGVQSISLAAGANAPSGYDSLSTGKSVLTPNNTRTGRPLDLSAGGSFGAKGYLNGSGNIGATGKTIYISFLQQPNGTTSYYEFEFHRGNLGDPGRIGGIGNDSGNNTGVYLRVPTAGQTLIAPGTTAVNFYVVRIDFLGGNDTVTVYQNPTSATEPASPTLTQSGAGDMSFSGLSMGSFNNGRTVAHDEIRVGETWADVTAPAVASTGLWDGGGADNYWATGGNWDNDVVPIFASALTFAGSTRLNNTNNLTGVTANSITFDSAAGAFTLAGNSLGLNGNITFNGNPAAPITETINLPLTATANFTIDLRTNGNIAIGGNLTGPNTTLTQTSTGNVGTLTLGGTNTLAGFIINGGTNRITGNTTIAGNGGSRVCLANAASGLNGTLVIENGANLGITGNFVDAAVIGRDGGIGTVIQKGGTVSFNPGNNQLFLIGATGNSTTRAEYRMNGGVFDMNNFKLGVGLGAGVLITGLVSQVSGVITNVGNFDLGTLTPNGLGEYDLTGGSIYIGSGGITSFDGIYAINLGGGTVGAVSGWSSTLNMKLTGINGPVTFNPGGFNIVLSGVLSGTGGLTVNGAGVLELSGANTYSGDTTVAAGSTLQFDVTGSSAGAFRVANGGTLNLNYSGTYAVGSFYTNGVALPIGTYNSGNVPGFIVGGGNLQVSSGISTGLWTGGGANNNWSTSANWDNNAVPIFPHAVTFAGSTRLVNTNDLSSITLSSLTFDAAAGAFTLGGNDVTLSGGIGFSANPPAPVTQTVNFGMTFTGNQTISLPTNGNLALNGSINSGNGLVKAGNGTLTLGGASDSFNGLSVTGGTNVITGNVSIVGNNTRIYVGDIGTVGTMVIQPGASLTVSGLFADAMVLGRDSGSGTLVQNGGNFIFNPANQAYLFVGASSSAATRAEYDMNGGTLDMNNYILAIALSANGSTLITGIVNQVSGNIVNLNKLDVGAFTFGPGHGIYRMSGGTMYIGNNGIVSDSGVYEVYLGGGTVGAFSSWISPLNMTLTGSNGPVTFDTAGNTIILTGILSGPGGFNLTGGGILELGGANTFAGDMTINSGTLQLDATGSSAGALRMVDGTTLTLNFGGNYVAAGFYTNGVPVVNGTYNAANMPAFINGPGNLVVQGVSTGHWTGSGANNFWSTAANWDGNAVPIFPLGLTFGSNARLNNTNDLTGVTATSLTFGNTAGAFTLQGNNLGLSGNIVFTANPASPITQTVNLPLTFSANVNVNTPANASLTINSDITAPNNGLFKLDTGTLTLGGSNTLAGFEADGGTNIITGNTTVAGTGGSRAYVANSDYVGGSVATMIIQNGSTFTVNGTVADAFVIGRDGGVGTLTQNGGTFNYAIANNNHMFVAAGNNPTTRGAYNMNGGLLDMNFNILGIGLGAGGATVTGVVNQASGVISNVDVVILGYNFGQVGHGIYNLTGGSLYIGTNGIQTQTGSYEINLGGGTVGAVASWSSTLGITLTGINGAGKFNPNGNTITLSGTVSGSGGLTVNGAGVLELSTSGTYTGDTTVTAGSTLQLDSTSTGSDAFRLANGAALNLNFIGSIQVASLFTNNVAVGSGTYNSSSLPGFVTGPGSIQVVGGIPSTPTNLSFSVTPGHINIQWPGNYLGWILQQQTNALSKGLGTNWVDVAGSGSVTSTNITISPGTPAAFYRLRYPN